MSSKRLFFALWPTDRERDRLRDIISPMAKNIEGCATFSGNWHVTLAFVGEFPEEMIPALQLAASKIEVEPFRLRFDRVEHWSQPMVACLVGASLPAELEKLVGSLNEVLAQFDIAPDTYSFRPHVTVATRARMFETQRLAQPAVSEWSEFELVESISTPGNITYRPLKQ
jgi:2'-5' RNA ligase